MSVSSCPGPDLLLLLEHGLLEHGDSTAAHVSSCAECTAQLESLRLALEVPPPADPPEELLEALELRLAEQRPAITVHRPEPAPIVATDEGPIRLLCTYCRDALGTPETVYCASCLAPVHEDCFAEHGGCAAPGCDGTVVVRRDGPTDSGRRVPPPRWRRRFGLLVLGAAVTGGAIAAWQPAAERELVQVLGAEVRVAPGEVVSLEVDWPEDDPPSGAREVPPGEAFGWLDDEVARVEWPVAEAPTQTTVFLIQGREPGHTSFWLEFERSGRALRYDVFVEGESHHASARARRRAELARREPEYLARRAALHAVHAGAIRSERDLAGAEGYYRRALLQREAATDAALAAHDLAAGSGFVPTEVKERALRCEEAEARARADYEAFVARKRELFRAAVEREGREAQVQRLLELLRAVDHECGLEYRRLRLTLERHYGERLRDDEPRCAVRAPEPSAGGEVEEGPFSLVVHDVSDLVVQRGALEPAEREPRLDLVVRRTSLEAVARELRASTGLDVVFPSGMNPQVQSGVDFELRDAPLSTVLEAVADQFDVGLRLEDGVLEFLGRGDSGRSYPGRIPEPGEPVQERPDLEALRALVRERVGVWPQLSEIRYVETDRPGQLSLGELLSPAELERQAEHGLRDGAPAFVAVRGAYLVALQRTSGQASIEACLKRLRVRSGGPGGHYWFAPDRSLPVAPGDARACRYVRLALAGRMRLDGAQDLGDLVSELTDELGLPLRMDPGLARIHPEEPAPVSASATGSQLEVLGLLARSQGLVLDVDRLGARLRRPESAPLEHELVRAARDAHWRPQALAALRATKPPPSLRPNSVEVERGWKSVGVQVLVEGLRSSGLDVVAEREHAWQSARYPVSSGSPANLLDLLDSLEGAGVRLEGEVLWIEGDGPSSALQAPRIALREVSFGESMSGADLGELAGRLEQVTSAHVVLGPRASRSRARVAIPAGLNVHAALSLVARQAGVTCAVGELPDGAPLLALELEGEEPLLEALRVVARDPLPGPERLVELYEGRRVLLSDALRDLAVRGPNLLAREDEGLFWELLETALRAAQDLLDVGAALEDLAVDNLQRRLRWREREIERQLLGLGGSGWADTSRHLSEVWATNTSETRFAEELYASRDAIAEAGGWKRNFPHGYRAWREEALARARAEARAEDWPAIGFRQDPNGELVVAEVMPGTPPAIAGLEVGDRLGRESDRRSLSWLYRAMARTRSEGADALALEVRRDGAPLTVRLPISSELTPGERRQRGRGGRER